MKTEEAVSPLRLAVYAGDREKATDLARRSGPIDVFDAAAIGDVDRLRELLDEDPDLATAVAADGFTPLHLAAFFGYPKAAELLLARGADPERVADNEMQVRPLHSAAAGGHATIAHLLLDRGADVDARQRGGYAPLHSAAAIGDVAMLELLLGRGADPGAAADDGRVPADMTDDPAIIALLP